MARIPIKAVRVAKGWTQAEAANKMGVSRSTYLKWETGQRKMKTAYVHEFCSVTGFSEEDILFPESAT